MCLWLIDVYTCRAGAAVCRGCQLFGHGLETGLKFCASVPLLLQSRPLHRANAQSCCASRSESAWQARRVVVFTVPRVPINIVHITPPPDGRLFHHLDCQILELRRVAILLDDGKSFGAMDLVRVNMFFEKSDFPRMRRITVMFV